MWQRYLLWFAHEHLDFRHAEIKSILSLFNIPIKFIEKPCVQKPYWIIELPSEECAKKIASRSVLLKNCIELWACAKTEKQLHSNLRAALNNNTHMWKSPGDPVESINSHICPSSLIVSSCPPNKSFKVDVETFCKHFSMKEKVDKIEAFHYLPLEGPVKLKNPDVILSYIEFYGVDPNNVPENPYGVFFGKFIAEGQRGVIQRHSLKARQFLGNTSMDPALALLAANQALAAPAQLALDPFAGSGSLLVAAAHFGAYVWGTDIDYMMLHGRTRPTRVGQKARSGSESIGGNLRQYGLQARYLDVAAADFSAPLWAPRLQLDAIITDPPYGIREPTSRIGPAAGGAPGPAGGAPGPAGGAPGHVPARVAYGLRRLFADLLQFAERHLREGGRLVTWYPCLRGEAAAEQLPRRRSLRLVARSEQPLSRLAARLLLTYEKLAPEHELDRRRLDDRHLDDRHLLDDRRLLDEQLLLDDQHTERMRVDPETHSFRDKYFSLGEMTRRERKERKAKEMENNPAWRRAHAASLQPT